MKTKVNAKLGLAIGVLSGIAKRELVDADYVIETAVSVPEVLKNIHKIIKHKEIKVSIVIFYIYNILAAKD